MNTDTAAPPLESPVPFRRALTTMDSGGALLWLLRLGAGFCFIGHGAFGVIGKEEWLPYFAVFGIGPAWAFRLMPLVGALDIIVGLLVIVRPRPLYLAYMVGWAVWTAALRPLAGEPVWELLERAGNYGVPLALLLLVLGCRSPHDADGTLSRGTRVLRWSTALLLFGHGALGLITQKPLLAEHYAAVGGGPGWVPLIGAVEIALAIGVLRARGPAFFLGVFFWKVGTESLFLVAGAPVWEFIERAGSYAAPLALFLLALRSRDLTPRAGIRAGRSRR